MAFSKVPTVMIANYSSDGTNMTLPIASFAQLLADEAHTTTGDNRKMLFAFIERFWQWYNGLAVADRPTKVTIARSSSTNDQTGVVRRTYTFTFDTEVSGIEVADEPA